VIITNSLTRILIAIVLATSSALATAKAVYPNKPVRVILPLAAGATTDIAARIIAENLAESFGQPFIVENRAGGNTMIGTEFVAKAAPDGYTLLVTTNAHTVMPLLFAAPYDPIKDFAAIATLTRGEWVLAVHPSLPANNLREFIALAKSKPGELNYGSSGTGGASHLATELFSLMAGIKMQHVPYKGGSAVVSDLVGGRLQSTLGVESIMVPLIKTGKLKAIAVSGESRFSSLPDVPTFTESGLPGFDAGFWVGMLAPAGTPPAILEKLSSEIDRILAKPAVKEKLAGIGASVFTSSRDDFAALLKADADKFGKVIKAANIKAD
jgi:tripartite-type tricarboxylate transporter receptor subunit TctC